MGIYIYRKSLIYVNSVLRTKEKLQSILMGTSHGGYRGLSVSKIKLKLDQKLQFLETNLCFFVFICDNISKIVSIIITYCKIHY